MNVFIVFVKFLSWIVISWRGPKDCHPKWTILLMGTALKSTFLWEDFSLGPQSGIVRFGIGKDQPTFHLHEFAQSHIRERRLPPFLRPKAYKARVRGVSP